MVSFKLFGGLLAVTCILATTQAAPAKKATQVDRIKALYVKDNSNGELRFLGGGINSNAQLNQLITQKQDMLEQLRPTTTGTGTGNWGSVSGTGTGLTSTGAAIGTGAASVISGLGGSGVTPIIINTSGVNSGTSSSNSAINSVINNSSPIASVLPQIIAQAAVRGGNRRRGANNNRRRRRPNRGGNRPQIFVVRPGN